MNTIGYTFNAPVHADQNTYIAKLDYNVDSSGKNRLFWRGNLQNDSADGTPQFQGSQPNSVTLVNNKGMAAGWTSVLTPSMVSSLHYGFTRAGGETTGILTSSIRELPRVSTPSAEPARERRELFRYTTFPRISRGARARTTCASAAWCAWSRTGP